MKKLFAAIWAWLRVEDNTKALSFPFVALSAMASSATYVYSQAFPTPDDVVIIAAQDFTFTDNVNTQVFRDEETPEGCLLTYNQSPFTGVKEDSATYLVRLARGGSYRLFIEYAAKVSRPLEVYVNDHRELGNVAAGTTRNWCELRWEEAGTVDMRRGLNYLRIAKADVFPHLKALKLVRVN